MANLTDAQVLVLNDWARTQPALRREFDYTQDQGVPGTAPPSDGLGDRLTAPAPGSEEELATLAKQIDFTLGDTVIYQGSADAGSVTSAAVWRITRATFVANPPNSEDIAIEFADGDSNFDNIWDNRLALSYGP
jgi:hypothetical protein